MEKSLKEKSFKIIYWIMLIFLIGDTVDTIYRSVNGYLSGGSSFPGVDFVFSPTTTDMLFFSLSQLGVIYGIYLLYNLKKSGGYWFLISNLLFLIYASLIGPIAEIGIIAILPMIALYFGIYIVLVICVPLYYSDKFE